MQPHNVEGYEHIEEASRLLKAVVDDLFDLPGAAQDRAAAERERLGDDHGDDLTCGCWAAHGAATALLELGGRHMDALVHLANEHPGFAPSATVLGRACLEALLRVGWLLEPDEVVGREQRWITLKREEARFYKNCGRMSDEHFASEMAYYDGLAEHLGGEQVKGTPSAEQLAKTLTTPLVYDFFYRWGSQPAHGTIPGAGTLDPSARQEWMSLGNEGEWIEAEFWALPLISCWEAAKVALPAYRDLLVPSQELKSLEAETRFRTSLRSVPANYQAKKSMGEKAGQGRTMNRAQRRAAARRRR